MPASFSTTSRISSELSGSAVSAGFSVSAGLSVPVCVSAVEDGFAPEDKPENYPGFHVIPERLNKPRKVDRSRVKYLLIGVLIALLLYFLPRIML